MRVLCDIEEIELESESGHDVPSVAAMCQKCGHSTESFGTSDDSVRRCLVLLREECPLGENNFYVAESCEP